MLFQPDDAFTFGLIACALDEIQFLPITLGIIGLDRQFRLITDAVGFEAKRAQDFGAVFGDDSESRARMLPQKIRDQFAQIPRGAHRVGEHDAAALGGEDRMGDRVESDVAAVIEEVFHALLERGVGERLSPVLAQHRPQ